MEPLTEGARLALLAVIALLLVTLGFLLALAWMARRASDERTGDALRRAVEPTSEGASAASDRVADTGGLKACPTCGNIYGGSLAFCPRDARRLVDADDVGERAPLAGGVCPRCQRGYPPGTPRCEDDGADLVPAALAASFSPPADDPAGEALGKICPRCKSRQAQAASFCGHDGARLVALN